MKKLIIGLIVLLFALPVMAHDDYDCSMWKFVTSTDPHSNEACAPKPEPKEIFSRGDCVDTPKGVGMVSNGSADFKNENRKRTFATIVYPYMRTVPTALESKMTKIPCAELLKRWPKDKIPELNRFVSMLYFADKIPDCCVWWGDKLTCLTCKGKP